jgi:hypothetical protein
MSKATKQQLAIISVVHGGLRAAKGCFEIGPELAALVAEADSQVKNTVIWWPITGDELEHRNWVKDKLAEWEVVMAAMPQKWSINANISVSIALLSDLFDKLSPGEKKARVGGLFPCLLAVHDWLDPKGSGVEHYEYADECLTALYRIMEFER